MHKLDILGSRLNEAEEAEYKATRAFDLAVLEYSHGQISHEEYKQVLDAMNTAREYLITAANAFDAASPAMFTRNRPEDLATDEAREDFWLQVEEFDKLNKDAS